MHDPRVGRFFAVDPLAAKYPHNSPYAFSENRVIDGVELEGLEYVNAFTGRWAPQMGGPTVRVGNFRAIRNDVYGKSQIFQYEKLGALQKAHGVPNFTTKRKQYNKYEDAEVIERDGQKYLQTTIRTKTTVIIYNDNRDREDENGDRIGSGSRVVSIRTGTSLLISEQKILEEKGESLFLSAADEDFRILEEKPLTWENKFYEKSQIGTETAKRDLSLWLASKVSEDLTDNSGYDEDIANKAAGAMKKLNDISKDLNKEIEKNLNK